MQRDHANVILRSAGRVIGLSLGKYGFIGAGFLAVLAAALPVLAGPEGGKVVRGNASINQRGNRTVIRAGDNAVINFRRFDINRGETVRFIQPNAQSRVMNRVTGSDPSRIDGILRSNGIVYIVNPAGVFFGQGALVDVGGIYAAAANMSNTDFLGGVDRFQGMGLVENRGTIQADAAAHLVGKQVVNAGQIVADGGVVTLLAGDDVLIGERSGGLMARVRGDAGGVTAQDAAGVSNSGTVRAEGGAVLFGVGDVYAMAVDQAGAVRAQNITIEGQGRGIVSVSGTVDASNATGEGGTVHLLGQKVGVFGGDVNASGATGGGEILVGGDVQGQGTVRNAAASYVSEDSTLRADATGRGDGGKVVVWANDRARVYGDISATGIGATGGFVETSGKNYLDVTKTPDVTSAGGVGGQWLLDPNNITIIAGGGSTAINGANPFASTGNSAQLGVNLITAALTGGASVTVTTSTGGANSQVGNITLNAALDFNGTGTNTLTLNAHNNIVINQAISDSSGAGDTLNLVLNADSDNNNAGTVDINAGVSLGGGTFASHGANFDSVGFDISAASIALDHAGDVSIFNSSDVNLETSTVDGELSVITSSGNITDSGAVTVGALATFQTTASNADITLDQLAVSGEIAVNTTGATGDATIVNSSAVVLGATNVGGALSVTATTGNFTDNGTITVGGAAAFATSASGATITADELAVSGAISLNTSGAAGHATITNEAGADLGASSVGGNLAVTASSGNITDSGTVTVAGTAQFTTDASNADITANQLAVTGAISVATNGATGDATIVNGTAVALGTVSVGGALDATATTGNITHSSTTTVGGNASFTTSQANADITLEQLAVSGTISVNTSGATGNATVVNATGVNLAASSVGGDLTATATTGNLTDSGTVTVGGNASLTTSQNNADINADQLALTGAALLSTTGATGSATIVNATGLNLGASSIGGDLAATATTGNLTDSGAITVGGAGAFTTSQADDDISLDQLAVTGLITPTTNGSGANVSIVNATGVDIGGWTVGGNLSVTATTGDITDSSAATIGGTAAFTTSQADADILLDALNATGAVGVSTNGTGGDATVVNAAVGGLDLAASSVGGALSATASTGGLTDSGTVTVDGAASFTTSAANADITVDQLAVTGTIALSTNGATGDATVVNATTLDLAASGVGGNLSATATTGDVTDIGTQTVGGTATFTTSQANASIALDQLAVTGDIAVNTSGGSGDASVTNSSGIALATSTVGGDLTVTATNGNLTDSGTVTVGGEAFFTTSQSNADITLNQLAVTGSIAVNTTGATGDALVLNSTGVDLVTSTVGGALSVTATTGNITDTDQTTVGGDAAFTTSAASAEIDLDLLAVTGTLSLNTNGATGHAAVTNATGVDLAASSVGGNLAVTATTGNVVDSGTVIVGGNASLTSSQNNADITANQLAVTGTIAVQTTGATGSATLVNSTGVSLAASSVGGDLSVTATTGNVSDAGTATVGGNAAFTTSQADDDISLDQLAVTGTLSLNTNGTTGNATVVNSTGVVLAATSVGGNLSITTTTGDLIDSDIATVGGTASFTTSASDAVINLDELNVTGTIALATTGAAADATVLNATGIDLAASNVGGDLIVGATLGNIVDSGTVTVGGSASFTTDQNNADITVNQLAVTGPIAVATTGATGAATVVNATALDLAESLVGGDLDATATLGNLTDSGTVTVGGNAAFTTGQANADITLDQLAVTGGITPVTSGAGADVTIVNATGVSVAGWTVGGNLSVTATTGNITDSGTTTVGGDASFTTLQNNADITLDELAVTGSVALSTTGGTGDATVVNATALDFDASNIGGTLNAAATLGNVTDSGVITVGGASAFTASNSGDDISLDQLASTGAVTLTTSGAGAHAAVVNTGALTLAASTIGGNLTATASTGNLTDSGTLTVGGDGSFTTSQSDADITLDQLAVTGTVALNTTGSGGDATVVNGTGLNFAASSIGGALTATATTGNVTDAGTVTVGAAASFTASQANDDITLDQLSVTGPISLSTNGATGHASITNAIATDLATSSVGGDLAVTVASGNLTDSGTITVGGNAAFSTGGSNDDISLDQLAVTGTLALTTTGATGNATVVNATGVDLAASSIGGDLNATATLGNLVDSGTVTVGGAAAFTTSQSNADITADQLSVTGAIGVNTTGATGSATVVNAIATDLGASNVGGNLDVTATTGAMTDSATVTVGGTGAFTTSAADADITLDGLAVTGAITPSTNGANADVTIVNATAVVMGGWTVGGNLSVTATTGDVTDSGTSTVGGDASFTTLESGADILVDELAVSGSIAVNTAGDGNATVVNATAVDVGASDVGGDLSVTATLGNITDSGVVTVEGNADFVVSEADADLILNQLHVTGALTMSTNGTGGDATIVNSRTVDVGASTIGGDLSVTTSVGDITDSGTITVAGDASLTTQQTGADIDVSFLAVTGSISLATTGADGSATIQNATGIDFGASSVGGYLEATASTGNITDAAAVTVGGYAEFTTSDVDADITLNQLTATGAIGLNTNGTTGHATIVNSTGVDLAESSVGGDLTVTATTGDITDSGPVTVGGTASFTTSETDADIALDQLAITGSITPVTTGSGADVTIVNAGGVNMAAWTVGGNLSVTATTGNITDTGTSTVGGNASFTTSQSNADITVDELAVTGSIGVSTTGTTGNAIVVNATAVDLSASNVGGTLDVTAILGDITDSGTVTVGGTGSFTASENGADIALDELAVTGAITPTNSGAGADVTIHNATGVSIAGWTVAGNLSVGATTGNVTDSGTVTVGGDATFTTNQSGADVLVDELTVTGSISVNTTGSGGNATVVNTSAVDLSASSVGGTLSITAGAGDITDSGTVQTGGPASFTPLQSGASVTLDQLAAAGALSFSMTGAGNVTIVNAAPTDIGASTIGGDLDVTASSGGITDSGIVSVAGDAFFTANESGVDITLNQLDVTGEITPVSSGDGADVTIVNTAGVDIGGWNVGGNLSVTANTGNITDSAASTVGGFAMFTTSQSNADILLDELAVTGGIGLNTSGSTADATIVNAGAVSLVTSGVGGALSVTATTGDITDSGNVLVGGTGSFTTSQEDADIVLNQISISGAITPVTNGAGADVTLVNSGAVDMTGWMVGGDLSVTATTGNITDSGANQIDGYASFTTSQSGADITLDLTTIGGAASFFTNGSGGNVSITHGAALVLGTSNISGMLTAETTAGGITDDGTTTVAGDASFATVESGADIALDQLAVNGSVFLTTTGSTGDATVTNSGALDLGASSVGGTLTATAQSGNLTDSGAVAVGGNAHFTTAQTNADINLSDLDAVGTITLHTSGASGNATVVNDDDVVLGASSIGGNLAITASTGTMTDSGTVAVGGDATFTTSQAGADMTLNQLAVDGAISPVTTGEGADVTIVNATGVDVAGWTVGGNLSVTASTGNITDSASSTVGGNAAFVTSQSGADITLDQTAVAGPVAFTTVGSGGNTTFTHASGVVLAASNIGGNLAVQATAGNITDSGTVTVAGTTSLTTLLSGADILVDQLAATGAVSLNTTGSGGNATVVNAGALNLAASSIGGALSARAAIGNLTDSGTVTVGGTATFTTSQGNADIIVDQLSVAAPGRISVNTNGSTGHATIVNSGAIDLATSLVGGNLAVTATTGNVTDFGTVTVGGNASFTTSQANADITMNQLAVTGAVSVHTNGSTGNALVLDTGPLTLAASTVGGSLSATATGGNLTDSGLVTVGGAGLFVTSLSGADILLDTTTVGGTTSFTTTGAGGNATFTSPGAVVLGASSVGGTLSVTTTTGNITDSGAVTIGGTSVFTTSQTGADIVLDQLAATGAVRVNTAGAGGNATLVNTIALNLGASNVGGAFSARAASGSLTDSGVVTVGGTSTFTTSQADADITLDQLAATGALSLSTTGTDGDATIVNDRTVVLGASTIGDDLSVTVNKIAPGTTGNLTDSGVVQVSGDASFHTTGVNSDINLDQLSVTGAVTLNTTGTTGNATLVNSSSLNLGPSNVRGSLNATSSTGNITDSGVVTVLKAGRFTTSTSGRDITLDQAAISRKTRLFTTGAGGNASVVNAGRLNLGASSVGGVLDATSTTGNLIDTGIVTVGGAGRFTTSQAGRKIILNQLSVSGGIRVFTTGALGHATIVNAGAVNLGQSLLGGDLTVTANTGNITDTGAITIGNDGLFTVLAGGADVLLDQTAAGGTIVINEP